MEDVQNLDGNRSPTAPHTSSDGVEQRLHPRVSLGTPAVAGNEVRVSAVVVRVEDRRWKEVGRCGVGAFFVGLDDDDERAIRTYIWESLPSR